MEYKTIMGDSKAVLREIEKYNRIVICRHSRPDGDAVGASFGLKGLIKLTWPEKEVLVVNSDKSENYAFLGKEDAQIDSYENTLMIVLDTSTVRRIANPRFREAPRVIKIDHHLDTEPYGDVEWIESFRSSTCEMIADLYNTFKDKLKMDRKTATCLYAGMCTDSGWFKYASTKPETLKLAAVLLEYGVDIEKLNARLNTTDYRILRFEAKVLNNIEMTPNGVAYFFVTEKIKEEFSLTEEETSMAVDYFNSIKGCLIWMLFIEQEDSIRVRIRSRFIQINNLAAKYGGGGHANACGATIYSNDDMQSMLGEADLMLKEFREANPDLK